MIATRWWGGVVLVGSLLGTSAGPALAGEGGRTFHVSAATGRDASDGRTPETAWRSLERVNAADLKPGDRVLFHRGETWRGQLVPASGQTGSPVTYGAYGTGERPQLLGSVSRSAPGDWHAEGGELWSTEALAFPESGTAAGAIVEGWSVYSEGGARAAGGPAAAGATKSPARVELRCERPGAASNHIQLSRGGLPVREGDLYELQFRARSTRPFVMSRISLMKQTAPWTSYGTAGPVDLKIGADATTYAVRFRATHTADDGRLTLFLGGVLPEGAAFTFEALSWRRRPGASGGELDVDVGNVILDGGRGVGVKKWSREDLKQAGDYWYDGATWQVVMRSPRNPAEMHRSLELALRRHIVDESNRSHVVYEGLALRYGAAHGIGGSNTHHIIVRDCDIAWIGGGHQMTRPDGRPVRFGNGIEFWEGAHDNLVEGCRIWEIYDAALTNQGGRDNVQENLTYRDNVIWNSEYSFEYWNRGPESHTRNVRFEHNTCVGAGRGWGHGQRPDPNGRHLMFYQNPAQTSGVVVRANILADASESGLRMENDWRTGLRMERNLWWQPTGPLALFVGTPFAASQFEEYRMRTGLDEGSIVADPGFVNAAGRDFRLAEGSPGRTMGGAEGPAGSRRRLAE